MSIIGSDVGGAFDSDASTVNPMQLDTLLIRPQAKAAVVRHGILSSQIVKPPGARKGCFSLRKLRQIRANASQ